MLIAHQKVFPNFQIRFAKRTNSHSEGKMMTKVIFPPPLKLRTGTARRIRSKSPSYSEESGKEIMQRTPWDVGSQKEDKGIFYS